MFILAQGTLTEKKSYESIYRLVLLTHESRGPVVGAIAGKHRTTSIWYLGSSPYESLHLAIPSFLTALLIAQRPAK